MAASSYKREGPLHDGSVAVIIGGGPGGTGCAFALRNLAQKLGKRIRIVLYEGKIFEEGTHYNQCAGVLSPPIVEIMEQGLHVEFPWKLVQRRIDGYILHSESGEIELKKEGDFTYVLRRINFDAHLLKQARAKGVEVIQSRVTDIEFGRDGVMVYSEGQNTKADVVIGAFGMDDGTAKIFERATAYRQPRFLSSIVIKIHPGQLFMAHFGNHIHAFLPPINKIEFGAVTPKRNHLTLNIAGIGISSESMNAFLRYPPVKNILPPGFDPDDESIRYFKGRFPLQAARMFYGDRFVIVGDAAGLLRPFKGKGINMAFITAMKAANTIMLKGISKYAFEKDYRFECREFIKDIPYGRAMRWLAIKSSRWRFLDPILEISRGDPIWEDALFNCVSAHKSFRQIFRAAFHLRLVSQLIGILLLRFVRTIVRLRLPALGKED